MASRADLIMAQVRGELSQIYRKKKDEGSVIDDITAGILGYQTGQEAMYAIEGAVKDFKEFRSNKYQRQSARADRRERRINRRMDRMDAREQRRVNAIDMSIPDFEEKDTIYESNFSNMDAPMIKPDRPMDKSIFTEESEMLPNMITDEEKLPISEEDVMDRTSEYYLENTYDVTMSPNGGMMYPAMAESTGYNYSNINISDLPNTNYDLDAIKATAQAAGVTRFFTGGDMSDVEPKEDEIVSEAIKKLTTG